MLACMDREERCISTPPWNVVAGAHTQTPPYIIVKVPHPVLSRSSPPPDTDVWLLPNNRIVTTDLLA